MELAEKIALVLAFLLLSIGFASSVYIYKTEEEEKQIIGEGFLVIDNKNTSLDVIFRTCAQKEIETNRGNFSGVSLSCIVNSSAISESQYKTYVIVGMDGYSQTVTWHDLNKGILTSDRETVFPHLPGKFWVKNVVRIEVK